MSWLEGLAQQDWRMFHSDSEVQVIAEHALALLKEQDDRMMDEKKDEMHDLIDCAYKNIGNAKSANDGMTAVVCMLGSIAHSLIAIAVMMRDNDDK